MENCKFCDKSYVWSHDVTRHVKAKHSGEGNVSEKIVEYSTHIFHAPTTLCISGSTGSGKTTLLKKILSYKDDLFTKSTKRIVYCYSEWQPAFDDMEKKLDISFYRGLPTSSEIEDFTGDREHVIVVLDDLMHDVVKSTHVQDMFTKGSHHRNMTLIYLSQNLYCQGKNARTQSLNTHYYILMRSPRDKSQIGVMARQTGLGSALIEAYQDCTSQPYGYLLLDLSPHSQENYVLKTDIFPGECPIVYLPYK